METPNHKILSFEEFLNQKPEAGHNDMPAETPEMPELPTADGDPAGDAPVSTDVELVDGPNGEVKAENESAEEVIPGEEIPAEDSVSEAEGEETEDEGSEEHTAQ